MKTVLDQAHGVLTVYLEGELDAVVVPQLRPAVDQVLARGDGHALIVDLSDLRLLDSCGVGLLVYLFRRLRASGRAFAVRGACEQPLSILRLMKLDQVFLAEPGPAPWRSVLV
jgi:anti-sigma B factor antagonist